jgi:hypothetical protein
MIAPIVRPRGTSPSTGRRRRSYLAHRRSEDRHRSSRSDPDPCHERGREQVESRRSSGCRSRGGRPGRHRPTPPRIAASTMTSRRPRLCRG